MKNIIYKVLIGLFILIFIINIFSILNIPFWGFRIYKIGSGSMEPYLKVNDLIVIKERKNYKVGDIVTYKEKGEYITHRIESIDGNTVITKGDNNNTSDKEIKKGAIIGSLVLRLHLLSLLSRPILWIILFVIGLIVTILIPDKRKERS